jgi:hypothetical protein
VVAAQADEGPGFWSIAGWVVAGLALAGAAWLLLRGRRETGDEEPADGPADGDEPADEPVAAGARITNWSYRDGPE